MSEDVLGYRSHTIGERIQMTAKVFDDKNLTYAKVNDCRVEFTNPKTLKREAVDVSRLIRVFVNNFESHKRSVK